MNVILTLGILAVLATITICIIPGLHLEQPWLQLWALVRAATQLALLTFVPASVISEIEGWLALGATPRRAA